VKFVNCREWISEIVECARAGREPGAELARHLLECSRCQERWQDERSLTAHFGVIRDSAATRRRLDTRQERIMREFAMVHSRARLKWALGAAAVLLLTIALALVWRSRIVTQKSAIVSQAVSQPAEEADNSDPGDDNEFIDVPYAPPLATGEFVKIVRMELRPIALAGMGVDIDATGANDIPADVIVGEDGFPRAVRVLD
jgi:hypothetical protein